MRGVDQVRRELGGRGAEALEPHDHVVWFGDGREDLYALARSALATGAERNEKLMFVARDPDPELLGALPDLDRLLERGQLELAATDDVYGTWDTFNA